MNPRFYAFVDLTPKSCWHRIRRDGRPDIIHGDEPDTAENLFFLECRGNLDELRWVREHVKQQVLVIIHLEATMRMTARQRGYHHLFMIPVAMKSVVPVLFL